MKIYLSSLTMAVIRGLKIQKSNDKPNVLLSFGVLKNDDYLIMEKNRHLIDSLILDSGTFSSFFNDEFSPSQITFDGYIEYLRVCADKYDFYFNFDKNFTIDGFGENLFFLNQLRKNGFTPVPVIHDYYRDEIDYYIKEGYEMVALGSVMEQGSNKFLRNDFDVKHAVGRLIKHNIKIHVFASATYNLLNDIPVYSSDASSWAQHAATGKILYWNFNKEGDDKTDLIRFNDRRNLKPDGNWFFQDYPFRLELEAHLDTLGITYEDLMGGEFTEKRMIVNAAYYIQLEKILSKKHKEQGFPF